MTTDKQERKERPVARGVLDYFPDALVEIAHVSYVGNQQHNPGQELHWAREKSTDHADCIVRHLMERGKTDTDGMRHSAKMAWRALALLQTELEKDKSVCDCGGYCDCSAAKAAISPPAGRIYIAGPMRGYPDHNFPAFHRAAALGRSLGYDIINPAEEDEKAPVSGTDTEKCRQYARRDTDLIFKCGGIAMLPGWWMSVGATAEVSLAKWLNLPVLNALTFKPLVN